MNFGGKRYRYSILGGLITSFTLINFSGIVMKAQAQLPPSPKKPIPEIEESTPETENSTPNWEIIPTETPPETEVIPPETQTEAETEPAPSPEQWRNVKLVRTFSDLESTPQAIIFTPDGKHLISGGGFSDPYLRIWSLTTGNRLKQMKVQRTAVNDLAMTPNGSTLLSAGEDGALNAWDWPTGRYIGLSLEHQGQITSLAITPDGQVLVSAGLDGLRVWTLQPRRRLYQLAGLGNPSYAVAVNPNGVIVASGGIKGLVRFWDLRQGSLISEFYPHQEDITGLLFTPDGKKFITSSTDSTIKIWDLATGKLIDTFSGHSAQVRAIALNPDGKTLASASNDGIRIWNLETGTLINRLTKHYDWVQSLAFSADGRYLASGGFDFTINIWERSPTPILPPGSGRVEQLFNQESTPEPPNFWQN